MTMRPNRGECPPEAVGKRVRVVLANGRPGATYEHLDPMLRPGWAADGEQGCRWTLTGDEWDIDLWELAG